MVQYHLCWNAALAGSFGSDFDTEDHHASFDCSQVILLPHSKLTVLTLASGHITMANDTFPFFSLPRELRDMIYVRLGGKRIGSKSDKRWSLYHHPKPSFRLVSRQFGAEYQAEMDRRSTLMVPLPFGQDATLDSRLAEFLAHDDYRPVLSKARYLWIFFVTAAHECNGKLDIQGTPSDRLDMASAFWPSF